MKPTPHKGFNECSHVTEVPECGKLPSGNGFRRKFPRVAGELPSNRGKYSDKSLAIREVLTPEQRLQLETFRDFQF
jgi:hypothetical protein